MVRLLPGIQLKLQVHLFTTCSHTVRFGASFETARDRDDARDRDRRRRGGRGRPQFLP